MTSRVLLDDLDMNEEQRRTLDGEPFTGVGFELHPDGSLREEQTFVDGVEEGLGREWFPNGQLAEEGPSHNGAPHGTIRRYYESGALKQEDVCEYGICLRRKRWDEAGNLVENYALADDHWQMKLLLTRRAQEKPVRG